MKTKILFSSVPKLNELKYYQVVLNFKNDGFNDGISYFSRQKIKAREIVSAHNDFLAAPVDGKWSQIHVITPVRPENSEIDIFGVFEKMNLSLVGPFSLHQTVYLNCIRFTLNVRMSGDWNQIQNYFVKNGSFLKTNETLDTVQLHMIMTDGRLGFHPKPLRLRLPLLNLIDLNVDFEQFYKFDCIDIKQQVYILPDLKPATAFRIYTKLPDSCPFKNFSDIKNYWKVSHGYDLPDTGDETLYVEVTFGWSKMTYTYPTICVCPYEPIQFGSKNEYKTVNEFIEVLQKKFPKICGHPFQLNPKPENVFHPITKLYSACKSTNHPNIISEEDYNRLESKSQYLTDLPLSNNQPLSKTNDRFEKSSTFPPVPAAPTLVIHNEAFKCSPKFTPKRRMHPRDDVGQFKRLKTSLKGNYNGIEMAAQMKTLDSYTVSTLLKFCRDNNVRVRSKEKKENLIRKIHEFFAE